MDPAVASIALFFAFILFTAAVAAPLGIGGVEGALARVGLGAGLALLGAFYVWLAITAQ